MKKKTFLIISLIIICFFSVYNVNAKTITRADAALYIAEKLNIEHTNDPKTLYGLAFNVFAGDYIDNIDVSSYNKKMTLEVLIVTLVRYKGWNTVEYDTSKIDKVSNYVTKEGYPFYSPDPTPRSIPYVIVALDKGLLKEEELNYLKKILNLKENYVGRI